MCRDLREEVAGVQSRELELSHRKSDLEKQLELAEAETLTVKNELKIALRRIDDLQAAIGGEMDSDFVSDQVLGCCYYNIRCLCESGYCPVWF